MSQLLAILPIAIFFSLLFLLFWLGKKHYSFNQRVLVSLILGLVFGFILQLSLHTHHHAALLLTDQAFHLISYTYLSLLKMLVIPLILTSIVHAMLNLGNYVARLIKNLVLRSVAMLLLMTAISSAIAIAVGYVFHVGQGLHVPMETITPKHHYTGLVDTLLGLIPSNPFSAMVHENTVAIVVFAMFLGMSALILYRENQEKVTSFSGFFESAFFVVKKLASLVISLTPYGILALMSHITATEGLQAILGIANFVVAIYVAMALVIAMHLLVVMLSGVNPWTFVRNVYPALLVAFTTRSSFGSLPVSEEVLREGLQVRQMVATFVPSMGATVGMNACAGVFPAMLVVMAMAVTHQPITISTVLAVMFINMIASLGISGIPGTAFVAATVTLTALGLPFSVVLLVQGIDAIVDMGRTATNVNGMLATAVVVDKSLD